MPRCAASMRRSYAATSRRKSTWPTRMQATSATNVRLLRAPTQLSTTGKHRHRSAHHNRMQRKALKKAKGCRTWTVVVKALHTPAPAETRRSGPSSGRNRRSCTDTCST